MNDKRIHLASSFARMIDPSHAIAPRSEAHLRRSSRGRGFTLIEMLVVIAIVIIMVSILIVTIRAATRTAQRTNTATLMTSIEKALVAFKGDMGYYPPVLGPRSFNTSPAPFEPALAGTVAASKYRRLSEFNPEHPTLLTADHSAMTDTYRDGIQDWYSITSLAEYLLGYGSHYEDGYGVTPPGVAPTTWAAESPPLGLRHPGPDGAWGASANSDPGNPFGELSDRNAYFGTEAVPTNRDQGKRYGPYLELADQRLLGALAVDAADNVLLDGDGNPRIAMPGEQNYRSGSPKVILDYWGSAIRYYRPVYRPGAITQPYRAFQTIAGGASGAQAPMSSPPSLADVFVLRPWELRAGTGIDGFKDMSLTIPGGDSTTSSELLSAPFVIFSAGHDRRVDPLVRRDDAPPTAAAHKDRVNEDNLVEVGK